MAGGVNDLKLSMERLPNPSTKWLEIGHSSQVVFAATLQPPWGTPILIKRIAMLAWCGF